MKQLFSVSIISFAVLLFSCAPTEENKTAAKKDSLPDSLLFESNTTALQVIPAILPPAFTLDTLSVEDTSKHLHAFFHFPVSSNQKLNEMVIKLVKENTKGYEDYHPGEFESTSIEAWISSCSVTGQLISMCFTDQSFTDGAAHFNHGYTTLNYDTLKQKQVYLTDIFNLRSEKEKQDFCDSILSPDINVNSRIEKDDLKKETDFTIEKGNLIFYFDDYEKGPSMSTIVVPLQAVRKFTKKEYDWLVN